MIKYIFNTSLRQEVIIDTDSNIDGYQYHYINVVEHMASGGEVQRFYQAVVVTKTSSLTYHDSFATDWFLIKNNKLYVCTDENGECLVEYSSEHKGKTLPLTPFSRIEICVNKKDSAIGYAVAEFAKSVIDRVFNVNVASIPVVNVG
ncbi:MULTISPECIES: hypothetical protein [Vibrio]|uniref:hypothetical protein n=1 Tax=Gammaproteobacteria TaxID=1236 RepID=UPI001120E2CD|nr:MULTISPECIES: hypothetical protein [Vibrio]EIO3215745.1 hypothetical protein [Vibrio parahaemolyticus]ELA9297186.1 hypothetical protein [Vibrio parahaemolyticus]MBO0210107.1 hypothetical protein [Vibrio sp. Vb0877]MCZ5870501.1 hypothetical protein [Vibrio parahaemolyticus]MCZ5900889.1 hypothetical protein [Vibrio parahaemolyticus]